MTGTNFEGVRVTFLYTSHLGQVQLVVVNAWTAPANYDAQKAAFQWLAERISGIRVTSILIELGDERRKRVRGV